MEPRKEMINWGEQEEDEVIKIKDLTNGHCFSKVGEQGVRENESFD